jgi:hypothetical protein
MTIAPPSGVSDCGSGRSHHSGKKRNVAVAADLHSLLYPGKTENRSRGRSPAFENLGRKKFSGRKRIRFSYLFPMLASWVVSILSHKMRVFSHPTPAISREITFC